MAKVMIFALFDRKVREYGPPLVAANVPSMYRELRRSIQPGSMLEKYPEDFDLQKFGVMDTETGRVEVDDEITLCDNLGVILSGGV